MEFPLDTIREMLDQYDDEGDILEYLECQKRALQTKMASYRDVTTSLEQLIRQEREAQRIMATTTFEIEEKDVPAQLIAGVRMKGHYSDCGKGFAKIGRSLGRYINGKPFCLYYDGEYKEEDVDLEACMPVREHKEVEGISVRELPGAHCVTLLHRGPYVELGRSYEKALAYVKAKGYTPQLPTREVYIKGPGMLLRGNPKTYLTEIQIPVVETSIRHSGVVRTHRLPLFEVRRRSFGLLFIRRITWIRRVSDRWTVSRSASQVSFV